MATKHQIQLIHIATSQLNIDDETYREILTQFDATSSKDLSITQADALLKHLKSKGFKVKRKKATVSRCGKIVAIASPSQQALIEVLKNNVTWKTENGYTRWLETRMKIKKVLTKNEAIKVIEGLKGVLKIKSKDILFLNLPLPINLATIPTNDTGYIDSWYFDTQNNRLIQIKNGEICQIIG